MNPSLDDLITITPHPERQLSASTNWEPEVGREARRLIGRTFLDEGGSAVLRDAAEILGRGVSPLDVAEAVTGLVVGYVQSGKTLSFTTVAALARDNGFPLVIVIAGTSTALLRQSSERLNEDLSVGERGRHLHWISYNNPEEVEYVSIQQKFEEWNDPNVPRDECPTILITVMKHHSYLQKVTELLRRLELSQVPTLIIDDEADQASLNTRVNQEDESTTYRCLVELRNAAPFHTYLQYTATPQAPLLISIIDSMSPEFVQVLEPGNGYVGGFDFFGNSDHARSYVRVIPPREIPSPDDPLDETPASLIQALKVFLIGVAAGLTERHNTVGYRSMLVHPSHRTPLHGEYCNRIEFILEEWKLILNESDTDDYEDLANDFREAYADIARTTPDLPPFDELYVNLRRALRLTNVKEVNAADGPTPTINWSQAYAWILVGGQAMDRGFTVEGLTVTYMPRGLGVGNADVVQQRGRFFGYKRGYLGYCRIYLAQEVRTAFEQYVEHEEDVRQSLQEFSKEGTHLKEWKRAFILSPGLRPCRNSVVQYGYARLNLATRWTTIGASSTPGEVVRENRKIVQELVERLTFTPDKIFPSTRVAQQHEVCSIGLQELVDSLLIPFRTSSARDAGSTTGLYMHLSHALEDNPDETAVIYRMRPRYRPGRRVNEHGRVRELQQGPTRATGKSEERYSYPGDLAFRVDDEVTVQIHHIDLMDKERNTIALDVPVLAVWVPDRMGQHFLFQSQQ